MTRGRLGAWGSRLPTWDLRLGAWRLGLGFATSILVAAAPQNPAAVQLSNPRVDLAQYFGLTPQFAISPDGQQLIFVASPPGRAPMLWNRSLSAAEPRPLAGTEQASYPFWSADGKSVGFFAAGKLKTLAISGGAPLIVCDAPTGRGGTWNADNVIVFASGIQDPLRKVPASGGTPEPITVVDVPRENTHRWPQFLPDGKHVLFWGGTGTAPPQLKIASIDSKDVVVFGPADANGAFAAGYLFYKTGNTLMAQRFDAGALRKTGDPIKVVEPISNDAGSAFASFSAAPSGAIVYTKGSARPFVLTWFDRTGRTLGTVGSPGQYTNVTLSPDDTRAAVSLTAGTPPNRNIWILDLTKGNPMQVTTDPAVDATPVWSADGTEIVYSSQRTGPYQLFRDALGRLSAPTRLMTTTTADIATDWSRDGKWIALTRPGSGTGLDVWIVQLDEMKAAPFVQTPAIEDNAAFSPTGGWMAYQSNASGRDEIYLRLFPPRPGIDMTVRVSRDGGTQPRWRGDGKELFFLAPDGGVMSATIIGSTSVTAEVPQRILPAMMTLVIRHAYSVTKDGQRFLIPVVDQSNPPVIEAVANWPATVQ